jgi:hypothetical protein
MYPSLVVLIIATEGDKFYEQWRLRMLYYKTKCEPSTNSKNLIYLYGITLIYTSKNKTLKRLITSQQK